MSSRYISLYYGSLDARRALVLLGAWITSPFVSRKLRERALANAVRDHIGSGDTFAFSTARGALAAALKAAGIGSGDEVVLSAFTCLAVPTAVLAAKATPVYADIEIPSLNVTASTMIAAMGPKVRAVVIQHTLGAAAEVADVVRAARERSILVIEDCALSVGTRYRGYPTGSQADAAIYSMELSKTLSAGWGGLLVVQTSGLSKRINDFYATVPRKHPWIVLRDIIQIIVSSLSYDRRLFAVGRYIVAAAFRMRLFRGSTPSNELRGRPAYDFIAKLSGAQISLATAQWRRLEEVASRSRKSTELFSKSLAQVGFEPLGVADQVNFAVSPRTSFLVSDPARAVSWFAANGIELGRWFDGPLTPTPEDDAFNFSAKRYPNASFVAQHIVNLPSHFGVDVRDRGRIVDLIFRFAKEQPPQPVAGLGNSISTAAAMAP